MAKRMIHLPKALITSRMVKPKVGATMISMQYRKGLDQAELSIHSALKGRHSEDE